MIFSDYIQHMTHLGQLGVDARREIHHPVVNSILYKYSILYQFSSELLLSHQVRNSISLDLLAKTHPNSLGGWL